MKDEGGYRAEDIFNRAFELEPGKRRAFIVEACADDTGLLEEVKRLFDSPDGQCLEPPSVDEARASAGEEHLVVVGQIISHYKILKKLGAGGMGEVYLAEDTALGRTVAVKVLSAEFALKKESLRRFEQEAKAASALNHPNILTIYEFGEAEGVRFIATEFINGSTLRKHLTEDEKPRRLKATEILEIAVQIASALAAAHEAQIIHRDIKPENIMLRRDGYVKVLDFGLAKLNLPKETGVQDDTEAQTRFKTTPGLVLGTAAYMSPEQARGLTVDARTDIWSLGVVLYEMATGHLPLGGDTQSDVLVAVLDKHPPVLKHYVDDAPTELNRIIDKALAKNVEERYQVIKDLALDLKSLKHRLEFEAELERSNPPSETDESAANSRFALTDDEPGKSSEAVTQMIPAAATASITTRKPVEHSRHAFKSKNRSLVLASLITSVLLIAAIGVFVWKSDSSGTADRPRRQICPLPLTRPRLNLLDY